MKRGVTREASDICITSGDRAFLGGTCGKGVGKSEDHSPGASLRAGCVCCSVDGAESLRWSWKGGDGAAWKHPSSCPPLTWLGSSCTAGIRGTQWDTLIGRRTIVWAMGKSYGQDGAAFEGSMVSWA